MKVPTTPNWFNILKEEIKKGKTDESSSDANKHEKEGKDSS